MASMTALSLVLVLDTATRQPVVGLAESDGGLVGQRRWQSEHRHGEELLQKIDEVLAGASATSEDIGGVIVGIGPGSFTGLRIGLATAKTIAYSRGVPIIGVSTTQALALAANAEEGGRSGFAVTLPAGAKDRYVHRLAVDGDSSSVTEAGPPQLVVPGPAFDEACGEALIVAVDLDNAADISDEDAARGEAAIAGLARALATLGAVALTAGKQDDIEKLVPAYVALPRGIAQAAAEMKWSPDLR
jgi:tRNA threonylcarbamoyl adenosine modification protein YeaZ